MKIEIKKLIKANYQQVILVFLAFLAMVLVSYYYVSGIVQKQMLSIGNEIMNTTENAVTSNLSVTELSFANIAHTVESMLTNKKTNEELLYFLTSMTDYFGQENSPLPDFMKMYGYVRGEFLDGAGWIPPDDFEPTERPWYLGAIGNNGIYFSEPYLDAQTGGVCMSFSEKLHDENGVVHGILAMDINLTSISDYVSSQKLANNGYGILLSDTLVFSAHNNPDLVGKNISDAGGDYDMLANMLQNGQPISAIRFKDTDGVDSIAYFRTIFNGWHIGVITPRSSYYEQVYVLAYVLSVLGFILMLVLSYMLVRTNVAKIRSDEENKSKSSFLARMSHEIRTPMNAIIGMTDIAKSSKDMDKIKYCLDKINGASNHLLGVINDILDMSKISAGKLEIFNTDFLLNKMLKQVTDIINFKLDEKKQELTVNIGSDVPIAIHSDQQRLAQVITNLFSNASKFTPDYGKISLDIELIEKDADKCRLQFTVTDNGIGISKEQQERLFQSFEQADGSISRKYGGTGLGLSISKKIVELMDGNIRVDSELGKGASFIFSISAQFVTDETILEKEDVEKNVIQIMQGSTPIFMGKRILLAEDVEINREILISLLEDTGVEIECAIDGGKACEMFAANWNQYDLIFMDIHMPEVDGFEATKRIRSMNFSNAGTIPIIAMTANVFKEDIDKCLQAGMNDHLGKPLEYDEVIKKMDYYLNK